VNRMAIPPGIRAHSRTRNWKVRVPFRKGIGIPMGILSTDVTGSNYLLPGFVYVTAVFFLFAESAHGQWQPSTRPRSPVMRTLVLRGRDGVDLDLAYVLHDLQRQRAPPVPDLEYAVPWEDTCT